MNSEITTASNAVKEYLKEESHVRFVAVTLKEPPPHAKEEDVQRLVEVIVLNPSTGIATELVVKENDVISSNKLPYGTQPMLTPDDCFLAEEIAKSSKELQVALKERYGIIDMDKVVGDPVSMNAFSFCIMFICTIFFFFSSI